MSSSHLPAGDDAGIFSNAEEHPWGESPHKRPSSSSSSSSGTDATSSADVAGASANNVGESTVVHLPTATPSKGRKAQEPFDERPTPSAVAADDTRNDNDDNKTNKTKAKPKPTLLPPMGFTPSPVPLKKMHPRRNQNQPKPAPSADDRTTTGAGAPRTPELLATIARRLGISPSKGANAADGEDTINQSNGQNTDDDDMNASLTGETIMKAFDATSANAGPSDANAGMASPVKSCRSIASGTLSTSSKHNNGADNAEAEGAGDAELDLSRLVEAHFDGAAAISSREALVQDAMKRRFGRENASANNAPAPTTPAAAGRSSAPNTTTTSDMDMDVSRNANVSGVVPDTPGSVPSVGLSMMLDGMMMSPESAAAVCATPNDIVASAGAGNNRSVMTIPEDSVVSHHYGGGDVSMTADGHGHDENVSPSKMRFADMMSICEEGEMNVTAASNDESRSVGSHHGRVPRPAAAPPSVCNGSHDLSAMCDYVLEEGDGNANLTTATTTGNPGNGNGGAAGVDSSFLSATHSAADYTVVNMTMARAAVQDESTMYDGANNDSSMYSLATSYATAQSNGINASTRTDTASELDMRGVSVFNHSTSAPSVADDGGRRSGDREHYDYPESPADSSAGSSSLPPAASYDDDSPRKGGDMDKSRSDDTSTGLGGFCLKFSREHWFLIATALLCTIGGLVGYGAAFGGWFSALSSPAAASVGGEDGASLDIVTEDQSEEEAEMDPFVVIPQFQTDSPTAMPVMPVMAVGDINFQPKPSPLPPTPRPSPAPTPFRGHETFSFYVIGDVPYTKAEEIIVEYQIKNMAVDAVPYLDNEGAQFAVHVGDIMKGGRQADCSKFRYELIENMYKEHCPIPSFMLPGDNDWVDCPNPTEGWANWMDSFGSMEVHWDGTTTLPSRVQRQPQRKENFAFHHGGVLFIGANLVSAEPYNVNANYRARMNENRAWVQQVLRRYQFNPNPSASDDVSIRAIFAFGHNRQTQFWRSVQDDIEEHDVPFVYFHGNGHSWYAERPFTDWNNMWISQVDMGGIAPPIKVTIQGTTEIARQYPPRKMSPHHIMMGSSIHVDRRGGTIKGPWSTSSFD